VAVAEVLSSPLLRAVETAERIAEPHRLEVSRDARLADLHAGRWEGRRLDELHGDPAYQRFLRDEERSPDGESLGDLRQRAVASIEQVVDDNQLGANLVVVSHALVVQVLVAHYLGVGLGEHQRLGIRPASISILRFDPDRGPPSLLALSHGSSLDDVLREG
jgi:broad specificity phosphatase PhoE